MRPPFLSDRQLIDSLRSTEVFAGIPHEALVDVAASAEVLRYERGNVIVRQGEMPDGYYVIAQGAVRVCREAPGTKVYEVTRRYAPTGIGELAILDGGGRTATVEAVTRTTIVVRVPNRVFLHVVRNDQSAANAMIDLLVRRIREATSRSGRIALYDLRARLAARLLELHSQTEPIGDYRRINVKQQELAEMVNASRQRVNLVLNEFQRKGYIELGPGGIAISSSDDLRSVGDPTGSVAPAATPED